MSRVDPPRPPLPTLPEKLPPRPEGGDFWARLQAPPEQAAADPSAAASFSGGGVAHARDRGSEGQEQVFAWSTLAGHRLSYLVHGQTPPAVTAAAAASALADMPAAAATAASQQSRVAAAGPVAAPVVREAALPRPSESRAPASDPADTAPRVGGDRRAAATEELLRRLHLLPVAGGVELVLRDYEQALGPDPVPRLLEYCRDRGLVPQRIVLNGHVVWSQNPSGKE